MFSFPIFEHPRESSLISVLTNCRAAFNKQFVSPVEFPNEPSHLAAAIQHIPECGSSSLFSHCVANDMKALLASDSFVFRKYRLKFRF